MLKQSSAAATIYGSQSQKRALIRILYAQYYMKPSVNMQSHYHRFYYSNRAVKCALPTIFLAMPLYVCSYTR